MIGKVDPEELATFFLSRTGATDDAVLVGPQYGEDAAAIRVGDETLVVSSDPISLAAERVGTLGVHIACNDVAASGATPRWLTNVVFLPDDDQALLDTVTAQIDAAANEVGAAVVGGHSEYAPNADRPTVSMTCLGIAEEFVSTGGAEPDDEIIVTKGAGIEGTAILATDFRGDLESLPAELVDRAAEFFDDISVLPESRRLAPLATAMHDPTEGGLVDGLLEMAVASGVRFDVSREAVPVREETRRICEVMDVDPLAMFGSGALVATVPSADRDDALDALDALDTAGIDAAAIGTVREREPPALILDGEEITEPVRDELYPLWE